jgi:hypothetical protein
MHGHEYLLPHEIHINCHITIMGILELLPQPSDMIRNLLEVQCALAPTAAFIVTVRVIVAVCILLLSYLFLPLL